MIYFASGSNHPGEILGFADCDHAVGVAIHELRGDALDVLCELHGDAPIFVDSGAFSEVVFDPAPRIAKLIDHAEWTHRLDDMERIARAVGPRAYLVAPDCVAHQAETLDRLARYAYRVRSFARAGANILVPVQKGAVPMAAFWDLATSILEIPAERLVAAIPMKKDATTTAELVDFLEAAQPRRVHLLGLGPKSRRFDEVVAAARAAAPGVELLCDSVAITSLVGRTNGPGGAARPLTVAHDAALDTTVERLFFEGVDGLDYTDAIATPSDWLTRAGLTRLARDLELDAADRRALLADPDGWLQDDDRFLDPRVELALDALWHDFVTKKGSVTWRKRTAICAVFGAAPDTRTDAESTTPDAGPDPEMDEGSDDHESPRSPRRDEGIRPRLPLRPRHQRRRRRRGLLRRRRPRAHARRHARRRRPREPPRPRPPEARQPPRHRPRLHVVLRPRGRRARLPPRRQRRRLRHRCRRRAAAQRLPVHDNDHEGIMMDTKKIRDAFEREFLGMSFERGVERLETLIGRFLRMGSFGDDGIRLARNVDYGGGRTTIDDRDFALVAFFAGAGRLALTETPTPDSIEAAARSFIETPYTVRRIPVVPNPNADDGKILLTSGTKAVAAVDVGVSVSRPSESIDLDCYIAKDRREESARENSVELSVELERDDITDEVAIGELERIVEIVREHRFESAQDAATKLPDALANAINAYFIGVGEPIRVGSDDIRVFVRLDGAVRIKVSELLAHGLTHGTRGKAPTATA